MIDRESECDKCLAIGTDTRVPEEHHVRLLALAPVACLEEELHELRVGGEIEQDASADEEVVDGAARVDAFQKRLQHRRRPMDDRGALDACDRVVRIELTMDVYVVLLEEILPTRIHGTVVGGHEECLQLRRQLTRVHHQVLVGRRCHQRLRRRRRTRGRMGGDGGGRGRWRGR